MNISPLLRERFIITADDYGIRQSAAPILRLAQKGKVDRIAVMVNYVSREDAEKLLETSTKIDIHLDLIQFLHRGERPGDSTLFRGLSFLARYLSGLVEPRSVEKEWRIQIEKFHVLFGRYPDGLNSHEHVHYFLSFFRIAIKLAQEFHIPYLRFGRKEMLLHLHRSLIGRILEFFAGRMKKNFEVSKLATSDYVIGFDWIDDFEHFLKKAPAEGSLELIFHPERKEEFEFIEKNIPPYAQRR